MGNRCEAERDEIARLREVVLSNLGLVVRIARRYEGLGLPFQDLVHEGVLGLFRAADRYDPRRGFRFATYARWWIREAMTSSLAALTGPCKVPVSVPLSLSKLQSAARRLSQELGRAPDFEEVTRAAGVAPQAATRAMSWSRARQARQGGPIGGTDLLQVLKAEPSREPKDQRLHGALSSIEERERHVVEARFGLRGRPAQTCRELGSRMGLCSERVRQIEKRALRKLRKALESAGDGSDLF